MFRAPTALTLTLSQRERGRFPGALIRRFNPLHAGHRRMAEIAQEMLRPAGGLGDLDRQRRQAAAGLHGNRAPARAVFRRSRRSISRRAATFEEKSRLFAGATFIVGADTLRRIAAPQYYGGSRRPASVPSSGSPAGAAGSGLRPRHGRPASSAWPTSSCPTALRALCREVPPEVFREDVSSTALRKSG